MRTKQQIEQILTDVRSRVATSNRTSGFDLNVPDDAYAQYDDWLNIVVAPGNGAIRAYQYVDLLGDLEDDLKASGVDHVVLVPALEY